jgi:hypothetical protein
VQRADGDDVGADHDADPRELVHGRDLVEDHDAGNGGQDRMGTHEDAEEPGRHGAEGCQVERERNGTTELRTPAVTA